MSGEFEKVLRMRVIPVVEIRDAALAGPLADALEAGGLPCAEITFRTAAARDAIRALSARKGLAVGAGTILNPEQARQAAESGAAFVVSPGFNPAVVRFCLGQGVAVLPGVCTPSEIMAALEMGVDILKFFPAEACGGLKTLKAIGPAFPGVRFVPTGGIGPDNLEEYLRHPQVAACGGSWMVQSKLIAERRFDEIARLTMEAVALAKRADSPSPSGADQAGPAAGKGA